MNERGTGRYGRIRAVVSVATVFAIVLGVVSPALAADTAILAGAVVAPDGSLAQGFTVHFKDVTSGKGFQSTPTGPKGEYQVSVPTGGKYQLEAALAPDGTRLAVDNVPPVPVLIAGTTRLDLQFTRTAATDAAAQAAAPASTPAAKPAAGSTSSASDDKNKKKGAVPWWKEPAPITGLVVGSVVFAGLIYLAIEDDSYGNNNYASPSHP